MAADDDTKPLPVVPIVSESTGSMPTWRAADPELDDVRVDEEVFGDDRLTRMVAAAEGVIDRTRSEGPSRTPAGSGQGWAAGWLGVRTAHVVQATRVGVDVVVAMLTAALGADVAGNPGALRLEGSTTRENGDTEFVGRLRMSRHTWRRVRILAYSTPSENLTVLEMLPARSWVRQTRRYLRAGVPAMTALTDELEAAAPST